MLVAHNVESSWNGGEGLELNLAVFSQKRLLKSSLGTKRGTRSWTKVQSLVLFERCHTSILELPPDLSSKRTLLIQSTFLIRKHYSHVKVEQSAVFNVKSLISSGLGLSSISLVDRQKTRAGYTASKLIKICSKNEKL